MLCLCLHLCVSVLLLCLSLCVLLLLCPRCLLSYHPFFPNHSHLPASYPEYTTAFYTHPAPSEQIEGWYIKLTTADQQRHLAFIFLYYYNHHTQREERDTDKAMVMMLDGEKEETCFQVFPISAFTANSLPSITDILTRMIVGSTHDTHTHTYTHTHTSRIHRVEINIGEHNLLSDNTLRVSLSSSTHPVSASLYFHSSNASLSARPCSVFSLHSVTVGFFGFLPLSCYQQVIDMEMDIRQGIVQTQGEQIDFAGGTAYLEKTRGSSFPSQYIWLHADHCNGEEHDGPTPSSFFFSIASVPLFNYLHLVGHVSSFLFNGTSFHLGTQLGSIITHIQVNQQHILLTLYTHDWTQKIQIHVTRHTGNQAREGRAGMLWTAKDGLLQQIIHQQIGWDHINIRMEEISRQHTEDYTSSSNESDPFLSAGYAVHRVLFDCHSHSMGLEVMVNDSAWLAEQVDSMYGDVRPWLNGYVKIHTPAFVFALSTRFFVDCLPAWMQRIAHRMSWAAAAYTTSLLLLAAVFPALYLHRGKKGQRVENR